MKTEILLQLITIALASEISPSEFEVPGDTCFSYDTCAVREFFRTCSCSSDCSRYGTCCFDALQYKHMSSMVEDFECYEGNVPKSVFVKKTCPIGFSGDMLIKNSCERADRNMSDLMMNVLVSSNRTWTTYRNWNCAVCNGEHRADLIFWAVQTSCPLESDGIRFDTGFVRKNLFYNNERGLWGISHAGKFFNCSFNFYPPNSLTHSMRYCASGIVSNCALDWDDEETANKCESYYGERRSRTTKVYYRNVHCALCNKLPLNDLECAGRNHMLSFPKNNGMSLRVAYSLNPWQKEIDDYVRCRRGLRYDPFLKTCRTVDCGLLPPGYDRKYCESSDSSRVFPAISWTFVLIYVLITKSAFKLFFSDRGF